MLADIEREMARFIGPLAKLLVTRAARVQADPDSLVAALAGSIESPDDRKAFIKAVQGHSFTGPAAPGTDEGMTRPRLPPSECSSSDSPPLTPEDVERTTRLLARCIGPIAKVVIKRAAVGGATRQDFILRVAGSLENPAARDRFLREAGVAPR